MLAEDLQRARNALFEENSEAPIHAARFMKSLSHPDRLKILCMVMDQEMSVAEIESAVGASQSAISQHLARLKDEGLLSARRDGRQIYYVIQDKTVLEIIRILYYRFCVSDE